MRKFLLAVLVVVLAGSSAFADMVLLPDQSQVTQDTGVRVSSTRLLCQTFTAGLTGNLEKVSLWFSDLADEQYPATISIVGTTNCVPNVGSPLWTGNFAKLAQGWFDVDTSSTAPFLTAGTVYGIKLVVTDNVVGDPDDLWNTAITGNPYPEGGLFENRGNGWVQPTIGGESRPDADAAFKTYIEAVVGDANLDGVVDTLDYLSLKRHYGMTGAMWLNGDFSGDGYVGLDDLRILEANFGASRANGGTPVPEPATLSLLVIGALALTRRRA